MALIDDVLVVEVHGVHFEHPPQIPDAVDRIQLMQGRKAGRDHGAQGLGQVGVLG